MADGIVWVYGTIADDDTTRARRFLAQNNIPFEFRDILGDADAAHVVERVTGGEHITPVLLFPDGTTLVEPTNQQIALHLGIPYSASA